MLYGLTSNGTKAEAITYYDLLAERLTLIWKLPLSDRYSTAEMECIYNGAWCGDIKSIGPIRNINPRFHEIAVTRFDTSADLGSMTGATWALQFHGHDGIRSSFTFLHPLLGVQTGENFETVRRVKLETAKRLVATLKHAQYGYSQSRGE